MKYTILTAATLAVIMSGQTQAAVMLAGDLSHEYNLQPGSTANGRLELRNTGNEVAEVKIYQEDVRIAADGRTQFASAIGSHGRSNARWISLPTDRIMLAPGAHQTINYTLQVPDNPSMAGSYWSTLMLEPIAKASVESQLAPPVDGPSMVIRQKMRYAVQVLTNIGNQGEANLSFAPPRIQRGDKGERWFDFDVHNSGNLFTRPTVWLDVFDPQGHKVGKFSADSHGLYAGEREGFRINLSSLTPGQYKGLLAAEDSSNGQVFGSDINLQIQP